jgi:hypothetical protein
MSNARAVTPWQAFDLMRTYARSSNLRLGAVAHAVINDLAGLPELASP